MTRFQQLAYRINSVLRLFSKVLRSGRRFFDMEKNSLTIKLEDRANDNLPNKKLCTNDSVVNTEKIESKSKKRNVAMLLSYYGANYWGMQSNPLMETIESVLLNALHKANAIPQEAVEQLHLINFQRAARTDKGVSAARQVVSFKIIGNNYDIASINCHLPEDIRVMSIKRVTKGFNSKNECTGRTYSYTLPTFALAPELHEEYPENYRINKEVLTKVNDLLTNFLGTKNFHNFTAKKDDKDPSAKRYIMSFKAEEPFTDGAEFITLKVKGQSFMLHQIRKMIGFTIAVLKGVIDDDMQKEVWKNTKLPIPKAPGLGLVLEEVHYDRYNKKFGSDGMHESLTWDEVAEQVENFRKKYILSNIIEKENVNKFMFEWIREYIPKYKIKYSEGENLESNKIEENNKMKAVLHSTDF